MAAQKNSRSWWVVFLVILFVLGDFAAAQPEPFLVAWWKFDDGGGNIAEDSAGTNDAMVEGPVWTTGVINGALAFSGGCVRPGYSPVLDELALHDFTIAMWISTSNAGQSVLIGNYMEPFLPSWNFEIFDGGVLRLYLYGEDHIDDVSVADGNWHHIAALRVGQQVNLYIDGQESYSGFSAKEPYMVTNPTLIGMDNRMEPVFFGGVMDDVRIYEAALTPEQIKRLAGIATWPSPTDGAGMIGVDAQLSWTAGVGALSHDVYLGTDNPPTTLIADDILDSNCFPDTLDCATLYYWRVDENTAAGAITGDVWSFTTIDGKATAPQPANGASGVSPDADLSWTAGACALSHDVWFGTDNPPTALIADDILDNNCVPGPLDGATVYYWSVDENTAAGTITGVVWSFRTEIWEIWVDDDYTAGGENDGHTWGIDAFDNIGAGIDAASNGDEIEVGPGTYYESINFDGKAVCLYSSGGPEVTTIDGTGHYHVVQCISGEDANTVLEGFTITGGNANGDWPHNSGGGMQNRTSSPTVTNCTFTGNEADYAGGMFNSGSSPTVTNCTFVGNTAGNGGGMYNESNSSPTVTNCRFIGNSASSYSDGSMGGGMYNEQSSPMVTNCTFTANIVSCEMHSARGGGMYNTNNSSPTVTNCIFTANKASSWEMEAIGGGMSNWDNSNPTVTNCTFTANIVSSEITNACGGGMHNWDNSNPTVTNCTFRGNQADEYGEGGGMYNSNSSPTVTNCILSNNTADCGGGMYNESSSSTITNCIMWFDSAGSLGDEIYNIRSRPAISYSDITGCGGSGAGWDGSLGTDVGGNIDADPLFFASAINDFHLKSEFGHATTDPSLPYVIWLVDTVTSPCIDAGDPNMDIGNEPEGNGGRINIGYYGGTYQASKSSYVETIEGDVDGDGKVDFKDVAILCNNWLAGTEP